MKDKVHQTSRRQFLEWVAAGGAGTALASWGTRTAQSKVEGRHHYKVFSEGKIGNMRLKNRLLRSAAFESAGSPMLKNRGAPTDTYLDIHRGYAEGGVGLIITGYIAVMEHESILTQIRAFEDEHIPGLRKIAENVHNAGTDAKIVAEIGHGGATIGPSGIKWAEKKAARVLELSEVEDIAANYGSAARRVKEAGFDGVEIHGAHHYLVNSFLSPYTNRRTDKYGGSAEKRLTFVREIVNAMRKEVGPDYPILIKLNCDDGPQDNGTEGEIDIEVFPKVVRAIADMGVDAIDVSGMEKPGDPLRMGLDTIDEYSFYERYADRLDIDIPIILGCGNKDIEQLEGIFNKGKVDFFSFARPLIREPGLPNRWLEGRGNSDAECISCSLCFRALYQTGRPVHCVQLERLRKETRRREESVGGAFGV